MSEDSNPPAPSGDELQFDHADYAEGQEVVPQCKGCNQPIVDTYYEVNGNLTCPACLEKVQAALTGGSRLRRFLRALVFGAIAAGIGSGIYYAIRYLTGYEFGLVAIVVGFMVGGAVRAGANARGGWFYQCLAMFLTYTAIASTYLPMILAELRSAADEASQKAPTIMTQPAPLDQPESAPTTAPALTEISEEDLEYVEDIDPGLKILLLLALALLVLVLAYAAPFVIAFSGDGFILLIIIGIGLYEAWRMNKRPQFQINGPYECVQEAAPPESSQEGV